MVFKTKEKLANGLLLDGLFPCLSGDDVTNNSAKSLVKEARQLISATEAVYRELYLTTLFRFAEFCQSIPLDKNDKPYSFLTRQLKLVIRALKLRQGMLLPENAGAEAIAQQEAQWTYAIFSASLFYQLDQLQETCQIVLYNVNGEQVGYWHPIVGNLYESDQYFSIHWRPTTLIPRNTLLAAIANRLMPTLVFHWLYQNSSLFMLWWSAITGDGHNVITEVLEKAAMQSGLFKVIVKEDEKEAVNENNSSYKNFIPPETSEDSYHEQKSEDLIQLLLSYLSNFPPVENNEVHWFRVNQGLFVCIPLIDKFIKSDAKWPNKDVFINAIQENLLSENNNYYFRYRPKAFEDRRILQGIIIQEEQLNSAWKEHPNNTDFQLAISL